MIDDYFSVWDRDKQNPVAFVTNFANISKYEKLKFFWNIL